MLHVIVAVLLAHGAMGTNMLSKRPTSSVYLQSKNPREVKTYEAPQLPKWAVKNARTPIRFHRYTRKRRNEKYNYLLSEDFEGDFPPSRWTVISQNTADSTWHKDSRWYHSGSYSALVWWSYADQDEWLISDSVILSGSPNDKYYFSFWTYAYKGSTHGDHYYVLIKSIADTSWDTLMDFAQFTAPDTGWVEQAFTFDISNYANDTVQVAFRAQATGGLWYIWGIDDVSFYAPYAHDVAPLSITSPVSDTVMPDDTVPINAVVGNFGINPDTFDVRCVIDSEGTTMLDTTVNLSLLPDSSEEVSFGNFVFKGMHVHYGLSIITELAQDEDRSNDTLHTVIYTLNPHIGGPCGFGYTFLDNDVSGGPDFSWIDPSSGQELTLGDDDTIGIDLPFAFPFYEGVISHLTLSSNGFLAGITKSTGFANYQLPDTTKYNIIAPWWDDLNPSSQGNVYYYVPSDSSYALIGFVNVPHYGQTVGNTFEVILYPNGDILMQYQHIDSSYANSSTIGIQGGYGDNNYYLEYIYNGYPLIPHDSLAIMFKRPVYNHDIALTDVKLNALAKINEDIPIEITVFNDGINQETDVEVKLDIYSADSALINSVSDIITSLDTYSTVCDTIVVPGITSVGAYYIKGYSTLSQDERPQNDTITTPLFVVNRIIDFENSQDRFSLLAGWQWGEPTSQDEPVAHSGSKMLGTVLGGNYDNNANFTMTRKFIIKGTNPTLLFYHWYDIESGYDGGNVKISKDNGQSFEMLYPEGGYPYDSISQDNAAIPNEPGFSGHQRTWQIAVFHIPNVTVGDTVIIKWQFGSDGSVNYPGWYIDDVAGIDMMPYYPLHDLVVSKIEPSSFVEPNSYFIPVVHITNEGLSNENAVLVAIVDSDSINMHGQTIQFDIDSFESKDVYLDPVLTGDEGITYHVMAKIIPIDGEDTTNNYLVKTFTTVKLEKNIEVPALAFSPDIDGIIKQGEWDDAKSIELSDVYGQGGTEIPPFTAKMYMKVDTFLSRLFIAVQEKYDPALSDYDQIGLFFDDNNDGLFPGPGNNTEGNYWLVYHPSGISYNYRPIYSDGTSGDTVVMSAAKGIGITDSFVSYEIEIPFGTEPEFINANPGDTIGFFAYAYDADNDVFYGWWPQDLIMNNWNKPAYYGKIILPQWTGVNEHKNNIKKLALLTKGNVFMHAPSLTLSIPEKTPLTLKVFDIEGRVVQNNNLILQSGIHSIKLKNNLRSGVYFVRISTSSSSINKKIVIAH